MKIIGLCGGSGSGKGAVSSLFLARGIPSIDTDAVYRDITSRDSDCLRALTAEFGDGILDCNGALDRAVLARLVFFGEGALIRRMRLNSISHKYILDEVRVRLSEYEAQGFVAAAVDAPLLFESGFDRECDVVVAVLADRAVRVERITARDGISESDAEHRIDSQISDEELLKRADYSIVNNTDIEMLSQSVDDVINKILNKTER